MQLCLAHLNLGYDITGNDARLAVRRIIEVDFGSSIRKRDKSFGIFLRIFIVT
jgi:hypothetical protein